MKYRLASFPSAALLAALWQALVVSAAGAAGDLLEPEVAFRFTARLTGPQLVEVRYLIADGYYMYRDKFRFSASPETVVLGTPDLPPGQIKHDEFFGRVETYRRGVLIRIPVSATSKGFHLTAISQGCADVGVCYTPLTQSVRLTFGLPPGNQEEPPGLLERLRRLMSGAAWALPVPDRRRDVQADDRAIPWSFQRNAHPRISGTPVAAPVRDKVAFVQPSEPVVVP